MTTLARLREAMAAPTCAECPPAADPFVPELPAATAPHGPGAARAIARELTDNGHHSHLAAYGETTCLTRQCGPALDTLRGLL